MLVHAPLKKVPDTFSAGEFADGGVDRYGPAAAVVVMMQGGVGAR